MHIYIYIHLTEHKKKRTALFPILVRFNLHILSLFPFLPSEERVVGDSWLMMTSL